MQHTKAHLTPATESISLKSNDRVYCLFPNPFRHCVFGYVVALYLRNWQPQNMKLKRITQVALNNNHSIRPHRTNHDYCSTLILIINWRCTTFIPDQPALTYRTCLSVCLSASSISCHSFIQSRIHIILSSFPSSPGLLLPPTKHGYQWDFGRHAGVVLPKRTLCVTSCIRQKRGWNNILCAVNESSR